MKVLLLAGAGASLELGVPTMRGLAEEFHEHVKQWRVFPELVDQLLDGGHDVELVIERVDQICAARQPLQLLGSPIPPVEAADTVRAELEWFVQHVAERISPSDAHLMWGSTLGAAGRHETTFVTTNYDRAIELAANAERYELDDGFESLASQEVARWQGFRKRSTRAPLLLKLHGSTDWYSDESTGEPVKLRHPMPLFGRGTLRLRPTLELGSSLVLPSREKILNRSPFPRLSQAFLTAIDECDFVIIVGSSLRDRHIRDAIASTLSPRPAFLVNPDGDRCGLDSVRPIRQSASQFLVSTLPAALASDSPADVLERSVDSSVPSASILSPLRIASDIKESWERRCAAIEHLARQEINLPLNVLKSLLSGPDSTVARYTLGLAGSGSVQSDLIQIAECCPHAADALFADELRLLKQLAAAQLDKSA